MRSSSWDLVPVCGYGCASVTSSGLAPVLRGPRRRFPAFPMFCVSHQRRRFPVFPVFCVCLHQCCLFPAFPVPSVFPLLESNTEGLCGVSDTGGCWKFRRLKAEMLACVVWTALL